MRSSSAEPQPPFAGSVRLPDSPRRPLPNQQPPYAYAPPKQLRQHLVVIHPQIRFTHSQHSLTHTIHSHPPFTRRYAVSTSPESGIVRDRANLFVFRDQTNLFVFQDQTNLFVGSEYPGCAKYARHCSQSGATRTRSVALFSFPASTGGCHPRLLPVTTHSRGYHFPHKPGVVTPGSGASPLTCTMLASCANRGLSPPGSAATLPSRHFSRPRTPRSAGPSR